MALEETITPRAQRSFSTLRWLHEPCKDSQTA